MLKFYGYCLLPLGTLFLLAVLILFVIVLSELIKVHDYSNNNNNNQPEMLTLVPSLALLFGSWYKLDVFFDVEKKKSKEKLLQEILQKMDTLVRNRGPGMEAGGTALPANSEPSDDA